MSNSVSIDVPSTGFVLIGQGPGVVSTISEKGIVRIAVGTDPLTTLAPIQDLGQDTRSRRVSSSDPIWGIAKNSKLVGVTYTPDTPQVASASDGSAISGATLPSGKGILGWLSYIQDVLSRTLLAKKFAITQTVYSINSASKIIVPADSERKYLAWQVISGQDVCVSVGELAEFGKGQIYTGPDDVNKQGAGQEWQNCAPTNAFSAICNGANTATLVVWVG